MTEKSKLSHLKAFKPKAGWLPLPKAVFSFGIADEANALANDLSTKEMARATASSVPELQAVLKDTSGATRVEINVVLCTFTFQFAQRGSISSGPPWAILEEVDDTRSSPNPRADAEILFNKAGLVRVNDDEAEKARLEVDAVREATGLVWRQLMLREFDRAIAANEIVLYARVGSAIAPFIALPSDVWRMLTILDWQNAVARDPEGTLFYSVHAQQARLAVSTARDESTAIRALAAELAHNPDLKRADAEAWCERSGFKLPRRAFRFRVWPKARGRAGLPETGSPGAKRKSVR